MEKKGTQLKVFVGSAMAEVQDARDIVRSDLGERGIDAFVYEASAGAAPESIIDTSLRGVKEADVFVGLFWKRFPKATTQEFEQARSSELPCFVYIRHKDLVRAP